MQSRRRSRQEGAAGSGALLPCSGKWRWLERSRGLVPRPRSRPEMCHTEWDAVSKKVTIATTGFAVIGLVTFLSLLPPAIFPPAWPLVKPSKPRSLLSSQRLQPWSRNVVLIDRSFCELSCRRLLAQLLRPAVTIPVWMNELWRTHQPRSPGFLYFVCQHTVYRQLQYVFWV